MNSKRGNNAWYVQQTLAGKGHTEEVLRAYLGDETFYREYEVVDSEGNCRLRRICEA